VAKLFLDIRGAHSVDEEQRRVGMPLLTSWIVSSQMISTATAGWTLL
jgi:hypothetical protein